MSVPMNHLLKAWALEGLSIVVCFLILSIPVTALDEESRQSILNLRVNSLKVAGADMEEALRLLREKDPFRILIGFERLPHPEGGKETNIFFELNQTTVGGVLNLLCKLDPRYTYETVGPTLINVFPVGSKNDMTNLLNIRVKETRINEKRLPHHIISHVTDFAPELAKYLAEKAQEYSARTGIHLGRVGAELRGTVGGINMDPEIRLELRDVTVREILNAVVLYSVKLSQGRSDLSPISWKYEFVIDPDAPTGLGGYPKWDVF